MENRGCLERIGRGRLMECAKLYVDVFNGEPWKDRWTLETACQRLTDLYDTPNFEGLLYLEGGAVKGAVFGYIEQFHDGRHYMVAEMFLGQDVQGKGKGKWILRELEARLRASGVTTMVLFTSRSNGTSRFYLKSGFEEWTSMVMMGKEI